MVALQGARSIAIIAIECYRTIKQQKEIYKKYAHAPETCFVASGCGVFYSRCMQLA